ncbi:MAG: GAF domain-containing protein, partial [Candidatus Rokuibacteriota bacterium]
LLASGLVEIYFSYQENKAGLVALQREKALGAASRIESFIKEIERQIGWTTQPQLVAPSAALEQRRLDYLRLLKQVPPITELSYLDASGKEQLRLSRLAMDVIGSQTDYARDPLFTVPKSGRIYYGPVTFRKESEPYMTIAMPISGASNESTLRVAGVTAAEVNLKFIWDVVNQIKVGRAGKAFVVDGQANLIAHPDISLVLQKTALGSLDQVRAALSAPPTHGATATDVPIAHDLQGRQVLTAHSMIVPLRWAVFVEQPLEEAFAPLRSSVTRTGLLVLLGVAFAVGASLILARRMVRPIRALEAGAAQIGAGELGHRIQVKTGDEIEALAARFNQMTAQLQESYATLEQKVEERTSELTEALEQQTATGEILGVISSSPTDIQPVFDAIARSAVRLCNGAGCAVVRFDGTLMHLVAQYTPERELGWGSSGRAAVRARFPLAPHRGLANGRAILDGAVVYIPDITQDPEYDSEMKRATPWARSVLAVPMLREGRPIGALAVGGRATEPFSDKQVALLRTFADQAVIAIENVRLFSELEARTAALSRSVEELTALGEVSHALSSTLHLETVLATIAARTNQLAAADGCTIYEYDETAEEFRLLRLSDDFAPDFVEAVRQRPIPKGEGIMGQAAARREPVQIPDLTVGAYQSPVRDLLAAAGYRALLAIPLIREDHVLGGLVINRKAAGEFPDEVVKLLQTFATQSALAIQNARLFREIEDKSRQLEVATRHKSEFLANMSHELRTPLNAVIGFSEVLLERMFGEINDKQEEYLQDILGSGRHLLSLINDILDLSKIEAGRMELELADFDLPQAIDNALTLVRERAGRRGITLTASVDGRLGEFRGDERKIKQVLLNVLSNAIKFTPEAGRVEVRAELVDGHVEISVSDTGIGIAPADQEAVFEEFRQVGTDYAMKREGTGLGLTLSRKFVELHGGAIWVKSAVGQGSTFTFTLPVTRWPTS